jgi:hypothetical protein
MVVGIMMDFELESVLLLRRQGMVIGSGDVSLIAG